MLRPSTNNETIQVSHDNDGGDGDVDGDDGDDDVD